ncbi:MAG: MATE family efflux transporter, partial [Lachnospiraceae bacterium]|nr:MATE family efflux transporter [Lachnospiraceae bacterium]
NRIYSLSLAFNLTISVIISAVLFFFAENILGLMQVDSIHMPYALEYMKIMGFFMFTQALFDAIGQIFRSNGLTQVGMVISLSINIINIVGNWMFLYGPLKFMDLGVKGVAISSVVSRIVALIFAMIYFKKHVEGEISIKYLVPFPVDMLKKLIRLGIPTAGENISYNMSQVVITTMVNMIGPVAVNAKIYGNILSNFSYVFSVSAAIATSIIVGHMVGADKLLVAKEKVLSTLKYSMILSISIAVVNFLVSGFTFDMFSNTQAVIELGKKIMFIGIFLEIGRTANLVVINSMRAAGDVRFPTILGIISNWGITVGIGFVLGIVLELGLVGLWIAMALDEILRGVIVYIRWRRDGWMGKSVVGQE